MSLTSPVLQQLDARLPLDGLLWDTAHGQASLPEAAVLVALTDEDQPQVLLGRRAMHLKHHPGEIAFPGGKREPEDTTPWVTAKREAYEEVGLPAELVHPLGELQPLVTRTSFEVHPCVARVPEQLSLVIDPGEFESVFTQPLARFADKALFRLETYDIDGRARRVPHYQMDSDDIWGVTAAILAMLANLAYDAGLELQRDWNNKP
jgi:8-oxo-dGTP pyrophosphatase MutT (NUDIX family)